MRHQKSGRRFNRDSAERQALTRIQLTQLLDHGRITTTEAKAKELRRWAERVITAAKGEDHVAARRHVARWVHTREASNKLFEKYLPKLQDRPGGYTRLLKVAPRPGDNAPMAIIELVGVTEA